MHYPMKFKPVYKDYIWGGRYFEKFSRELPQGILAESWELSCHKNGVSVVANGEQAGKTLPEIIKENPGNILGSKFSPDCAEIPLLVKFIDANDKLSVQVHPDDPYAAVHEGGLGKNEMWYIVDAQPGARIVAGLKPGVTREILARAAENNRLEECLQEIEVSPGDVINIPAGLMHAIGAGIVIAEIQQTSDITYRVYDYNRVDSKGESRPLHIEKALAVTDYNMCGREVKAPGVKLQLNKDCSKTIFLANRYFACERYDIDGIVTEVADGSKFYILICLEGQGTIRTETAKEDIRQGETVLIPAAMGQYTLEGNFTCLKAYIPDFRKDIVEPMKNAGCSDDEIFGVLNK